ncbi:hypothetical protein BDY24DRAFT_388111 [Mrakia frigida]|uniref:inositol polyphosphate multikinase n=1 Tax=Mrakia frigida TaxID=29902 RepID=UPI003FCC1B90
MSSAPIALASQVGGHAGVLTTEDGSLVIKPALPQEVDFYQSVATLDELSALQPFIPAFLGTLKLQGEIEPGKELDGKDLEGVAKGEEVEGVKKVAEEKEHIVITNLSHGFTRPCILDIKLGTVLYDIKTVTEDKKARMEKTARETTSLETGVRLTGFQNWDPSTSSVISTPKSYGKSISSADLPSGITKFFPLPPTGLPPTLLLQVLEDILLSLREISEALSATEGRFVGMSLLIVYEGDETVLREALAAEAEAILNEDADDDGESSGSEENWGEGGGEDGDGLGDGAGSAKGKGERKGTTLVKLIDFAHSRAAKGEGRDEGVIMGMETSIRLLEGRLAEVQAEAGPLEE